MENKENPSPIECIGFIMDGNRRFGKEKGWGEMSGHKAGKEKFLEVVNWVVDLKIPHAVFYAFSTENWQRQEAEVKRLLSIFRFFLKKEMLDKKYKVKIIGRVEDFPLDLQDKIKSSAKEQEKVEEKPITTIWVTLSYGGRLELLEAVKKMQTNALPATAENFRKCLWSADLPDLDLLIRTGGEKRLSNFLPWQTSYAELFFSDSYWPAFTKTEFLEILEQYKKRDRRIGR